MIELTGITASTPKNAASEAWPDVEHYGVSVFDSVDEHAFAKHLPEQYQECYLGYNTSSDRFVIGFDCWPDSDRNDYFGPNVFEFVLEEDGSVSDIKELDTGGRMFYGDGNYAAVHADFPNLIDIRLD